MSRAVLLVAIWLLAWGELTPVNVATGLVMAAVLLTAFPPGEGEIPTLRRVRPLPMLRLMAYIVAQLVVSNLVVAAQILRRQPGLKPAVIEYPMRQTSDLVVTSITSIIALSPGTMTVNVESDPPTLHVHYLSLDDPQEAARMLRKLEALTGAAFGEDVIL